MESLNGPKMRRERQKREEKYFVVRLTHFCHDSLHYCFYAALLSLRKNMHITHTHTARVSETRNEWNKLRCDKKEKENRSKGLTHCRKRTKKKNLIDSNPFHSIRFDSKIKYSGPSKFFFALALVAIIKRNSNQLRYKTRRCRKVHWVTELVCERKKMYYRWGEWAD